MAEKPNLTKLYEQKRKDKLVQQGYFTKLYMQKHGLDKKEQKKPEETKPAKSILSVFKKAAAEPKPIDKKPQEKNSFDFRDKKSEPGKKSFFGMFKKKSTEQAIEKKLGKLDKGQTIITKTISKELDSLKKFENTVTKDQVKNEKENIAALKKAEEMFKAPVLPAQVLPKDTKPEAAAKDVNPEAAAVPAKKPVFKKPELKKLVKLPMFMRPKKKKREKLTASERRRRLKIYMEKAGYEMEESKISRMLIRFTIGLEIVASLALGYLFYRGIISGVLELVVFVVLAWTLGFLVLLGMLWLFLYVFLDLKMYKRRLEIEEVFPDFLQLTSSNIRAGLPIDRALWYSIRPRFGVLAKEMEIVAKETLSGKDLEKALLEFSEKYDSMIIQRSIRLLVEGISAGGEIGELLNKISTNIQEARILKKEMAASVMTYVIFISFATIGAAPFLYALAYQMLAVITQITSGIQMPAEGSSGLGGFSFNLEGSALSTTDFTIFAVVSLALSSMFSAMIVSTIRKGNIKEGLQYIPIFMIVSIVLFFLARKVLGLFFGNLL
jgi:Flp pilus assembly protein TadB